MGGYKKQMQEIAKERELTRRLLKQFLYALHTSEGFGENRLLRVLLEWAEVYKVVNDPKNDSNDEMLMIDRVLDHAAPSGLVTGAIGKETLRDYRGRDLLCRKD